MTPQFVAATTRALYGGILSAALVFLTTLQIAEFRTAETIADAGIAAGVALLSYMIARGVAEGFVDSNRAASGNVLPSDVGSNLRN